MERVGRQAEWAAAVWRASNAGLWPKRRQEAEQRPGKEMAARKNHGPRQQHECTFIVVNLY